MTTLRRRRILWTGGFDSTALVLDSIRRGIRVVPFYLQYRGDDPWQKQIRETDARARIRQALPPELRNLLEPDVVLGFDELWNQARAIDGEIYHGRRRTLGPLEAASFSPQLPLIVAAGRAVPGLEAAYVAGDWSIDDGLQREYLASAVMLPLERETKRELWLDALVAGFDRLLELTWSCEGDDQETRTEPCGRCAPCLRRIIPAIVRTS